MADRSLLADDVRELREHQLDLYTSSHFMEWALPYVMILSWIVLVEWANADMLFFSLPFWSDLGDSFIKQALVAVIAFCSSTGIVGVVGSPVENYVIDKKEKNYHDVSKWSDQKLMEIHRQEEKKYNFEQVFMKIGWIVVAGLLFYDLIIADTIT